MSLKSTQKITQIHLQEAKKYALRLFAFTSAVFPVEWSESWNEMIALDLIEFAFHARKVNELCKIQEENFSDIDSLIVRISANDPGNWEKKYQYALNAFMHMSKVSVTATTPNKPYELKRAI